MEEVVSGIDGRLAPTFIAQFSLITRRQVIRAGGTNAEIRARLANGRWTAVARGVYALTGVGWSWHREAVAVGLTVPSLALSHRAAARLLGAGEFVSPPIDVAVKAGCRPRSLQEYGPGLGLGVVVHEAEDFPHAHLIERHGVKVTSPLRLALDLGGVVDFDTYRRVVRDLRADHGVTWAALERLYSRFGRRGRTGSAALRQLLERHSGSQIPDEIIEIRCADLLETAGLPTPTPQYEVARPDGRRVRFDLAYPELKIGIETEGRIHDRDDVRQRDHERRNNVQLIGWTVFYFTWEDVIYRPEYVVATVRSALSRAAATA